MFLRNERSRIRYNDHLCTAFRTLEDSSFRLQFILAHIKVWKAEFAIKSNQIQLVKSNL